MEYIDIFDADYNYLGKEEKNEAHRKGLWHQTFHCWIIKDNKLVVQLRSKDKSTNPNLLDISGAGHLSAGEKVEDGVRELKEELGLDINPKDLIYVGYFKWASDRELKTIIPYHNREFCHTFFLKSNMSISDYKLQPEELDGIFEIDIQDLKKLFLNKVNSISINGFLRNENNKLIENTRNVTIENFTKHDNLWLKVLNLIEDINNGRKDIFI